MAEWLEPGAVRSWLGDDSQTVGAALESAVLAVRAYVERTRRDLWEDTDTGRVFTPDQDVVLGAVMLAARWYQRRSSVLGTVTGYSDFGTATIMRYDPDVARLLRIGEFAPFGFGAPPA